MIESIFIVFLFATEFLSFVFVGERLKIYESVSKRKDGKELTKKEHYAMVRLVFRFFISILLLIFIVYSLFVAHLFWYGLATIVLALFIGQILNKLNLQEDSLNKRIWVMRIDAVITMLIWLVPFLTIIGGIF